MKKLFTILFASLFTLSNVDVKANSDNNTESVHLSKMEMNDYLMNMGYETEVNTVELNASLPVFEVEYNQNFDQVTFRFENPFKTSYTAVVYNMDGASVDSRYFVQDGQVSFNRGHLPAGDYIYNLQGEDGNIYSGLITYR